jgi:hypothetical protein
MSEDPVTEGLKLLAEFMAVGTATGRYGAQELRAWVHAHPTLLDPDLDQPLDDWLRAVREAEENDLAETLGAFAQLRKECSDYGIDAAFDSQAWEDEEDEIPGALLRMRSEAVRAEREYGQTRSVDDLQNTVQLWNQCVERAEAVGAPWLVRADFSISLSIAYLRRYRVIHDQADSEYAVSALRSIADQLPLTSGLRLTCLINLAIGWRDRFGLQHSLAALNSAIEVYEQVASDYLDARPREDQIVTAFGDLCRCLWVRYQMTGSIEDLRETRRAHKAWQAFTPEIRPQDAGWQAELQAALAKHGIVP